MLKERHQAKTVSQIKDFIGKLTGLQAEQQSLRIRKVGVWRDGMIWSTLNKWSASPFCIDINITEQISKTTMDQDFNKMLEIQQSMNYRKCDPASSTAQPISHRTL